MSKQEEIEKVMQERGLPYSKAKLLCELWEREDRTEGARDYVYGQDEGEAPKGAKW